MLFTDMIDEVLPEVPGCPDEMAVRAFRRTCEEFMRRTQIQTEVRLFAIEPSASVALSTASAPVTDILKVTCNNETLAVLARTDPRLADLGADEYALVWDGRLLMCHPHQTSAVELIATLVTAPGPAATSIDDHYWWLYGTCLSHGARGRLLAQPEKPWSNPAAAAYELGEFERLLAEHAMKAGSTRQHDARRIRVRST